ncbi:MAG TPA: hypothetical protein VKE70_20860 [Candidatus Solibacter sp.]|nr:hypothetical protein [Candidatus Solibacter sp.]
MNATINLPDDLYQKALAMAKEHQISVDDVFVSAFVEHLSALQRLKERAARGDREKFLAVLDRVPDVEPEEYDRL